MGTLVAATGSAHDWTGHDYRDVYCRYGYGAEFFSDRKWFLRGGCHARTRARSIHGAFGGRYVSKNRSQRSIGRGYGCLGASSRSYGADGHRGGAILYNFSDTSLAARL